MPFCYLCGSQAHIRACDSCEMGVCPEHRTVIQPPEMLPLFYCRLCMEFLRSCVGEDGLEPSIPDPDVVES